MDALSGYRVNRVNQGSTLGEGGENVRAQPSYDAPTSKHSSSMCVFVLGNKSSILALVSANIND